MKKRMLSLLLILAILLPMLPRLAIGAEAAETDELRQAITEQYDAYAASIKQPNADEEAIKQLLNHSIDHPGQYLEMDATDAVTACLFQTNLFREYFIETSAAAVKRMRNDRVERILLGGGNLGWHDFAVQYGARQYEYTDHVPLEDVDSHIESVFPFKSCSVSANEYDKAMILVVGGAYCWLRYNELAKDARNVTYRVDILVNDDFNFSGDYSQASAEGYDVSTSMLISLVGKLFLNEYSWSTSVSFELTVPNLCSHKTMAYRWEFDVLTPTACGSENTTDNPLTLIQEVRPDGTNFGPYYQTAKPVQLSHRLPWTLEFRTRGAASLMLGRFISYRDGEPFLLKGAAWVWGGYPAAYQVYDDEKGKEVTKYTQYNYGVTFSTSGYRPEDWHIFRLENRIAQDGSNMVYLLVDGNELGPMVEHYISGEGNQETTSEWFNGNDFIINFIGTNNVKLYAPLEIDYIQVWENGEGAEPYSYYETTTAAPTCTEPGKVVHTCSLCGASHYEVTEAALGHTPEAVPGVAANCEADGLTDGSKCTTCGEMVAEQAVIPALGHAWDEGAVVTGAACTQAGEMLYTCANDPSHTRTEAIAMLPHNAVTDAAVNATCTADGLTEGAHCADCGTVLTAQEVIPAPGHSWGEGELTVRPSEEGSGVMAYSCAACGEIREEEVPYQPPVRIAGANRFETAFLAADATKAELGVEKFENIIVASGTNFADALSGSYLASVKNAPILLSYTSDAINDRVKDYIRANLNPGGTVYILGGETAVPASMEEGLDGFTLRRLAGRDRFATNLAILSEAGVEGRDLLVCTGLDFADSLSAAATKLPILLAWDELTEAQKFFLDSAGIGDMYIIGGENAVSEALEAHLTLYGDVRRIGGANRFETSVNIAWKFFKNPDSAVLAYAWNYPDGLCGGALAATMDAPLILTMANYESAAATYVYENAIQTGTILGGESLIPDEGVRLIFGLDADMRITRK